MTKTLIMKQETARRTLTGNTQGDLNRKHDVQGAIQVSNTHDERQTTSMMLAQRLPPKAVEDWTLEGTGEIENNREIYDAENVQNTVQRTLRSNKSKRRQGKSTFGAKTHSSTYKVVVARRATQWGDGNVVSRQGLLPAGTLPRELMWR